MAKIWFLFFMVYRVCIPKTKSVNPVLSVLLTISTSAPQVLSPIVVSIMMTLQPFIATAIQTLVMRSGHWPRGLAMVGNVVLVAGSMLVCWASRYHVVADNDVVVDDSDDDDLMPQK